MYRLYWKYIFGIHLWIVLYPKPCYNKPYYKEVVMYQYSIVLISQEEDHINVFHVFGAFFLRFCIMLNLKLKLKSPFQQDF